MSDFGLLNWSSHVTRTFFRKCSTLPNLKLCLTTCSPYRAVRTRWSQNTHHMLQLLRGVDPTAEVVRERDRGVKKPTPTQHSLVHDTHMSRHMTASPATSYSPVPRYDTHAHTFFPHTHTHTHTRTKTSSHLYIHTHHMHTNTHTQTRTHGLHPYSNIHAHTISPLYSQTQMHTSSQGASEGQHTHACDHLRSFWYL